MAKTTLEITATPVHMSRWRLRSVRLITWGELGRRSAISISRIIIRGMSSTARAISFLMVRFTRRFLAFFFLTGIYLCTNYECYEYTLNYEILFSRLPSLDKDGQGEVDNFGIDVFQPPLAPPRLGGPKRKNVS